MKITHNKTERMNQKTFLRQFYSDYDPKHHDAFVIRYNQDLDKYVTVGYMTARGIIEVDSSGL